MHLNENDSSKFYRIWSGILEYTNQKYKAAPKLKAIRTAKSVTPAELVPIRDVLWQNTEIIDSPDEMFRSSHLPLFLETVLISFEVKIKV